MVITECCGNWGGDKAVLKEMVYKAKAAGSDFAKIQTFFADDLADSWAHDRDRLRSLELHWGDHARFVEWCKDVGITPMTSVYKLEYLQRLKECGFEWIKLGSPQAGATDIIERAKYLGLKVIVSTGGTSLEMLPNYSRFKVDAVLHCVSKYPHSPYEANLSRMISLYHRYPGCDVGFSDHTDPLHEEWDRPATLALVMGAKYIERHFTILDRDKTKDGPVSLDFGQLSELCATNRQLLGYRTFYPSDGVFFSPQTPDECDLIDRYKTRWLA